MKPLGLFSLCTLLPMVYTLPALQNRETGTDDSSVCWIESSPVGQKVGTEVALENRNIGPTVKTIYFWSGFASEFDATVVRGVQLEWTDGVKSSGAGRIGGDLKSLPLKEGETIKSMKIAGDQVVNRVEITTSESSALFTVGGSGGKVEDIDVGNGLLKSMKGWQDGPRGLQSLSATFQLNCPSTQPPPPPGCNCNTINLLDPKNICVSLCLGQHKG